jgi:hypothetical protein
MLGVVSYPCDLMLRCPRDLTSMRLQTELRTSNVVTRLWGNGEPIASDKDVRLKSRLMTLSSVAPCSHPVTVSAARSISSDPESSCVPDSRPSCGPNLRSHTRRDDSKGLRCRDAERTREKGYDAETLESRGEKGDVGYFGIWHHPAFAPRGRY